MLFEIQNITKAYPGVVANDDVSFDIAEGSIHALLGENGAGKSTLVKMMYGLVEPSSGAMRFQGAPFSPNAPKAARAAGIGMVFQHFSLFDALTVAENIEVGMENAPPRAKLARQIEEVSAQYGLPLDPRRLVGELSAGERQRVEIVRCLLQNPRLLIMDEPTSVLTPGEVEILFETLRKLKSEGVSILYISHKLDEIRALCDEAVVLRRGAVVGRADPREKSAGELAEMMVGERLNHASPRDVKFGDVRLSVTEAQLLTRAHFSVALKSASFDVHAGEILGIAGVAGNGQDELLALLSGERLAQSGQVIIDGQDITREGVKARRSLGLLAAPEERLGHAAVPDMTLTENTVLTAQKRAKLSNGSWINWPRARGFADEILATFDVRTPGNHVKASALSGGNLQKFVVGREMMQAPKVLVINQPTWGVDVAAASFIRGRLKALADEGAALVIISQDLDEVFELSDRIAVLCDGRLSPTHDARDLDMQSIGQLMGGAF